MRFRLVKDAPDDVDPVGAAVEGELRFGTAFARQAAMPSRIDIGRIGDDEVVALAAERLEQIAAVQRDAILQPVFADIARGDRERVV